MLIQPLEACRILAGEVFRRDRDLDNLRTGGLNSEKAVRHRLQSMAMELMRVPDLDDIVAFHLYAIQWNDEDPLTILEKTERLVEKRCRERVPSPDALAHTGDRITDLVVRLLVLQGVAGRVGRWAVRAGEIPDARTARSRYRELEKPEWSSYCTLIEEANAAFAAEDHRTAAIKIFDADRLVRTPASLVMAAVSLSRQEDFVGALWTIRTCLLEPPESFESEAAHRKARTLEQRLREIVEGRTSIPLDTEERRLLGAPSEVVEAVPAADSTPGIDVGAVDIVAEEKEVLYAEPASLSGEAVPPPVKIDDLWQEPRPVLIHSVEPLMREDPEPRQPTQPASLLHKQLVAQERARLDEELLQDTLVPPPPPTDLVKAKDVAEKEEAQLREEGRRLLRLVSDTYDAAFPEPPPSDAAEKARVPVGPSVEVSCEDVRGEAFEEQTEVPPEPLARRAGVEPGRAKDLYELTDVALDLPKEIPVTERIIRRTIPANRLEQETDVLGPARVLMGAHTRETALAASEQEEQAIQKRPPSGRVSLKRVYEVTHIVRPRAPAIREPEIETEVIASRSPLDQS